jgi:hypothetical protein
MMGLYIFLSNYTENKNEINTNNIKSVLDALPLMKEPCCLLGRKMAGPQSGHGVVSERIIPAPVGNQFWAVQPVAIHYID